ncbi:hypothetical protein LO762_07655 [Actinocorallia sp. API 0066]|uniref:hypothetical protein n=1 Tax=Actinocorallia sp. API 0066 TaxID=2896846 RepID=UPI001E4BBE5A|nr:hypothetical protein [Actinocorallia sp. API 0066]MCD0449063.1 hypothetical protein [Actinocorallia sp. API 0066]
MLFPAAALFEIGACSASNRASDDPRSPFRTDTIESLTPHPFRHPDEDGPSALLGGGSRPEEPPAERVTAGTNP